MFQSYITINLEANKELIIDKSRFIAHVKPCTSEEEAHHFIDSIKRIHPNASHNCSAYIIGEHDQHQKAHDDGEPSGTAGKPILEIIKKLHLKDTAIVVTRYFGGIKLGAGGLIRAYGQAAKEGIIAAGLIKKIPHQKIIATIDYTWHGKLQNQLNELGIIIEDTQFTDKVSLTCFAKQGEEDHLIELLTNLTSGTATITLGDTLLLDTPYEI